MCCLCVRFTGIFWVKIASTWKIMIYSTWSNDGKDHYKLKYSYIQYSHMCLLHLILHNIFSEQSTKTTQKSDPQYLFVHDVLKFIEKAQFSHLWLLNNVLSGHISNLNLLIFYKNKAHPIRT